ncbi:glycoside hydrolase superfamily [Triangularia verruculosa]|uniref:Beta-galactosidase n=1 Tax=Triangularia verruculosa TaxID=2587418 RepID=A0AAN6XHC5_9PEZI|nr:glycoside hydrolase superfamily [Triangularia verruculosa]
MAKLMSIVAMHLALSFIVPALATIRYVMPNDTWQINHTISSGPSWGLPLPQLPNANSTSSPSNGTSSSPFSYWNYNQDRMKTPPEGWEGPAVTYDNYSLSVYGERIMLYSGEFHYFRLPRSPELWGDVLMKIRAMGFNAISTYVPWMLLEPLQGVWDEVGWSDLESFLLSAQMNGLYVIARPGPYINGELTGGGFPGWLQRTKPILRTADLEFLQAAEGYTVKVAELIAKWQVDSGGPVILYQVENEYSLASGDYKAFPDNGYMQWLIEKAKNASITVPIINNDAWAAGHSRPGIGVGEVDIYGHDMYPFGLDCAVKDWPENAAYLDLWAKHLNMSAGTPYTIPEGGAYDSWGSVGYDECVKLFDDVQARILFKNTYANGVKIFNVYMIYGGTNWGNLGDPFVYTSYDYGAAIAEDRTVGRPKYSELKLQANFFKVSPGYLTALPNLNFTYNSLGFELNSSDGSPFVMQMTGPNGTFYVIRHGDYRETQTSKFRLLLPTSVGAYSIPQYASDFFLIGRDSKLLVTDYPFGNHILTYCSAEIFTWNSHNKTTLVLYGDVGEYHEFRFTHNWDSPHTSSSDGVTVTLWDHAVIVQWNVTSDRQWAVVNDVYIYLEDRVAAYRYWTVDLTPAFSEGASSIIVYGGYLIRTASETWLEGFVNTGLLITADFNQTTTLEIMNVPSRAQTLTVNQVPVNFTVNDHDNWVVTIDYKDPSNVGSIPDLVTDVEWHYRDSLPELQESYDDSGWLSAVLTTNNTDTAFVLTPTSLYGSDYGFHSGVLVFRGRFRATRHHVLLNMNTQGGAGYASSLWLNDTFLYSWAGNTQEKGNQVLWALPELKVDYNNLVNYTITVLVDNMGLEENLHVGSNLMKSPRGIMDYGIYDDEAKYIIADIDWKLTGNWKGEYYADRVRGPLNEGGLHAERMGYHLPGAPLSGDTSKDPFKDGIDKPGVAFWSAKLTFNLDIRYDIPLSFEFQDPRDSSVTNDCRIWLWVNGYQFGRYIPHIGPQREFPVPDGIIYTNGTENHIALAMWAPNEGGAKIPWLSLKTGHPVRSSRVPPGTLRSYVAESYYDGRDGSY